VKNNFRVKNKVLVLIPARKGSSRVKNKNIRIIKKKPLIQWTINFAKKIKLLKDIVISSDSLRVKKICDKNKDVVFIKRPKIFSTNKSGMNEVIIHTLEYLKKMNKTYDYIVLLQPTSPLREKKLVENGLNLLKKNKKYEFLYHLSAMQEFTGTVKNKKEFIPDFPINTRSQDIPKKFVPTGNLFIIKSSLFDKKKSYIKKNIKYLAMVTKNKQWVNIDYEKDFLLLDSYVKKNPNLLKF
jgi:CMP-N,N'-diacetyllegionaminic acid synthase